MLGKLAFYLFFPTRLINSIKYEHSSKILYDILQVKYRCDVDLWTPGPSNCRQSLLHRAIDENNEAVACFLIKR